MAGYSTDPVLVAAAGTIMLLPLLVLFIVLQRRFVEGMAASGLGS